MPAAGAPTYHSRFLSSIVRSPGKTVVMAVYTLPMTLKNAAALAFAGMLLLSVVLLLGFVRDLSSFLRDLIPGLRLFASLIYLFASLSLTVFLLVFYKAQR